MKRIATTLFFAVTAQARWFNDATYADRAAEFCQLKGLRETNCGDTGAPCGPKEACLFGGGVTQCRGLRVGFGDRTCASGLIRNPFGDGSAGCIRPQRLREGLCRANQEKNGGCTDDNDCQGTLRCDTKIS